MRPVEQRGHDPEREQVARRQIRDRDAHPHRPLPWRPGDAHQPAHALGDLIDAGARGVWSCLAEPADAAIDQPRIDGMHVVPRDLEAMLHIRPHVLDDHVRRRDQLHERRVTLGRLQVELNHALVAMQVLEIRPIAVAADFLAARIRWLDPDHVGAPIRQMPDGGRASTGQREVENHDLVEWQPNRLVELSRVNIGRRVRVRHLMLSQDIPPRVYRGHRCRQPPQMRTAGSNPAVRRFTCEPPGLTRRFVVDP